MKQYLNKAKYVMSGEDGASNLEIVVWFSVILMVATALFLFKDKILGFLSGAGNSVSKLNLK